MTTEERIANLEKRVTVLENLVKWTAVPTWLRTDGSQIFQMEKDGNEIILKNDYEKLSDAEKAQIDLFKNTFRKLRRILEFVLTWSANIKPPSELGLDKEIEK